MEPNQTDLLALLADLARYPVAKPVQALLSALVDARQHDAGKLQIMGEALQQLEAHVSQRDAEREHAMCALRSMAQMIREGAEAADVLPVMLQLVGDPCPECLGGCAGCTAPAGAGQPGAEG
jgi:hypothetical protein